MAETQTPNFHWIKPDLGGDAATWGNVLNTTFDAVDSVVFANQQALVPIGTIMMFGGGTAPLNWLMCDGAVYLNTDVPNLVPILGTSFPGSDASHTAVPNLSGRFPIGRDGTGWTRGLTGGEYNHQLLAGEMPAHNHDATQAAHTHSIYQDVHNHGAYQDVHAHVVANGTHYHNITTGGHGHNIHTGNHSHALTQSFGLSYNVPGGAGAQGVTGGVAAANTNTAGDLGGYVDGAGNLGGNTDSQYSNIGNADNRQPAVYVDNRQPVVHSDTQTPTVNVTNRGGNLTHNTMPPYTCVAFIIRYR